MQSNPAAISIHFLIQYLQEGPCVSFNGSLPLFDFQLELSFRELDLDSVSQTCCTNLVSLPMDLTFSVGSSLSTGLTKIPLHCGCDSGWSVPFLLTSCVKWAYYKCVKTSTPKYKIKSAHLVSFLKVQSHVLRDQWNCAFNSFGRYIFPVSLGICSSCFIYKWTHRQTYFHPWMFDIFHIFFHYFVSQFKYIFKGEKTRWVAIIAQESYTGWPIASRTTKSWNLLG